MTTLGDDVLQAYLTALEQRGCRVGREGERVWITTPVGHMFRSEDYSPAQGRAWGAVQRAMREVGMTDEDIFR